MRPVNFSDIPYLIDAGQQWAEQSVIEIDLDWYAEKVVEIIQDPATVSMVIPDTAHCIGVVSPTLYTSDLVLRVISTYGPGGMQCLKALIAETQVSRVSVDGFGERLDKAYKRMGFTHRENVYWRQEWVLIH